MEAKPKCDFSVIIVNYNTADFIVRCLESVASQSRVNFQVIVVDNASHDDSLEMVKGSFPWVRLIANDSNLGFARANNQALEICKGKYVYFLNPDTAVRQGSFVAMLEFMDTHPDVGLAGTRILNPDGSLQSSVEERYPGERTAKEELKGLKGNIAWVLGASMVARRDILLNLGGFDDSFFLYAEDLDLCLRMRQNGWGIGFISEAVVFHWGGQSERENLPVEVWAKKFQAEMDFYRKHYTERTIKAIRRNNLLQAFWRILTLKMILPFSKEKTGLMNKLIKYKTAVQFFHQSAVRR